MDMNNITSTNNIIINKKFVGTSISSCFFMLIDVKSFEIFLKHEGYFFISESFALNCYIFVALTKTKLLLP